MSIKQVESLLSDKIGLLAETLGAGGVESAVRQRVLACRASGVEAYLERLAAHPEELERLIDEVVVRESWFFREPAAFELLRERYLQRAGRGTFRVLSLPCATGEEPYSIAITLLEAGALAFEVWGVDVSTRAIELAERGVYSKGSLRGGVGSHAHGFELEGGKHRVTEAVRKHVRFGRGNVLDPLLFAGERFDAVFCRNLLIYLDARSRAAALGNLGRLLHDHGTLFSGHSESSEVVAAAFRKVGDARCFAFEKAQPSARPQIASAPRSAPSTPRSPPKTRVVLPKRGESVKITTRGSGRSSRRPSRAPRTGNGAGKTAADGLSRARTLADRGELAAARKTCEEHLAANGPSADAFFLLGLLQKTAGDAAAALESFGKALYLESAHEEAIVHAALIHEHAGRMQEARKLRARLERVRRSKERR